MCSSKGCDRGVRRWVVEGCGRLDSPTSIEGDLNCRNQVGISRDEHGDVVAVVSGAPKMRWVGRFAGLRLAGQT